MWTRKLTVIGGQTEEDDWIILRNGQEVGRVHRATPIVGLQKMEWVTWTAPWDKGRADTLDQAIEAVRTAIRNRWPDTEPEVPRS